MCLWGAEQAQPPAHPSRSRSFVTRARIPRGQGGFSFPADGRAAPPSMGAEHPQTCSVQILGAPVGLGLWELLLWGRGECVIPSFVGLQGWGSPAAVPRDLDKVNLG